jgi:hypothetical protein
VVKWTSALADTLTRSKTGLPNAELNPVPLFAVLPVAGMTVGAIDDWSIADIVVDEAADAC